jgi:hypothetical protein
MEKGIENGKNRERKAFFYFKLVNIKLEYI